MIRLTKGSTNEECFLWFKEIFIKSIFDNAALNRIGQPNKDYDPILGYTATFVRQFSHTEISQCLREHAEPYFVFLGCGERRERHGAPYFLLNMWLEKEEQIISRLYTANELL